MTKFIGKLIRLMAYRHSLNKKNKNKRLLLLLLRPKADLVEKSCWLATTLDNGLLVECHQNSVFRDSVVKY